MPMMSVGQFTGVDSLETAVAILAKKVGQVEAHDLVFGDPEIVAAEQAAEILEQYDNEESDGFTDLTGEEDHQHFQEPW